jgi:hypothetical protein
MQYNGDKKDDIIPLYVYETDNIDEVERCVKAYAKQYQYRRYKEVYKADINMLKDLINDCGEFNEKTNLKIKWKSNKQTGGNHYIAIFKISSRRIVYIINIVIIIPFYDFFNISSNSLIRKSFFRLSIIRSLLLSFSSNIIF